MKYTKKSYNNYLLKQQYLSPEMCDFLGLPMGSKLSRSQLEGRIKAYINKLRVGSIIYLDKPLKTLFGNVDTLDWFVCVYTLTNAHFIDNKEINKLVNNEINSVNAFFNNRNPSKYLKLLVLERMWIHEIYNSGDLIKMLK